MYLKKNEMPFGLTKRMNLYIAIYELLKKTSFVIVTFIRENKFLGSKNDV